MNTRPARRFHKLDVRPLVRKGGQPFNLIKSKIDALVPGEGLELVAPFMPAPLVEFLTAQGFESEMEHLEDGSWTVWFWKP